METHQGQGQNWRKRKKKTEEKHFTHTSRKKKRKKKMVRMAGTFTRMNKKKSSHTNTPKLTQLEKPERWQRQNERCIRKRNTTRHIFNAKTFRMENNNKQKKNEIPYKKLVTTKL